MPLVRNLTVVSRTMLADLLGSGTGTTADTRDFAQSLDFDDQAQAIQSEDLVRLCNPLTGQSVQVFRYVLIAKLRPAD